MNLTIPPNIKSMMGKLNDAGYKAYIIGGACRDTVYGVEPNDHDVFTDATGDEILKMFPQGKVMGGEERQSKILTVLVGSVEISSFRANPERTMTGTSLEDHLSTCDFKFNALYCDITGEIKDPFYGIMDIKEGRISCVGNAVKRLDEDKLRALRAVRFILRYGLTDIDHVLKREMNKVDLTTLPASRIRDEFVAICNYEDGPELLYDLGLLTKFIPEFDTLNIDGGQHHKEKVTTHSWDAFRYARRLTDNIIACITIMLHDIGKGVCREFLDGDDGEDADTVRFSKHNLKGADMVENILTRLEFNLNDVKYAKTLVHNHMFGFVMEHRTSVYTKLFETLEDNNVPVQDMMLLNYCDQQANHANPRETYHDYLLRIKLLEKYHELKYSNVPFRVTDLEITGHDIMALGIDPGPGVGKLLDATFTAVNDGLITNSRPELLEYIRGEVK